VIPEPTAPRLPLFLGLFDARTFRCCPRNPPICSHFLLFYASTRAGVGKVSSVRLENGQIVIHDSAQKRITLPASLPL
jgi:hypothetical protein